MTQYIEIDDNGDKFYYKDKDFKVRHRIDGPAVELADGYKAWYLNGKRHRIDGPAIERRDGTKSWFLNGEEYTEEEFKAKMNPILELTVADLEKLLGKKVKIIK